MEQLVKFFVVNCKMLSILLYSDGCYLAVCLLVDTQTSELQLHCGGNLSGMCRTQQVCQSSNLIGCVKRCCQGSGTYAHIAVYTILTNRTNQSFDKYFTIAYLCIPSHTSLNMCLAVDNYTHGQTVDTRLFYSPPTKSHPTRLGFGCFTFTNQSTSTCMYAMAILFYKHTFHRSWAADTGQL